MRREVLFHSFFLIVFIFLLYQFGLILGPFLTPILAALVLWILAYPLHLRLSRQWPHRRPSYHAAVSTLIVVTLVVVPFLLLCWLLFSESESVTPQLQQWSAALQNWRESDQWLSLPFVRWAETTIRHTLGVGRAEFQRVAMQVAGSVFATVSMTGQAIAKNAIVSVFQLLVVVFTLFFLFRDGQNWIAQFKKLIPMRSKDKERILERLRSTITGLVRGSIVTAALQGVFATIGYLIAGVPAAVTLGMLTAFAAFIPMVGSSLIWLPISIGFILQGHLFHGIFILVWGILIVGLLDNFLRSWMIGKQAQLPVLFLFFSLLGGAEVYGVKGLLIGPLLVAIIPVFMDIYADTYLTRDE